MPEEGLLSKLKKWATEDPVPASGAAAATPPVPPTPANPLPALAPVVATPALQFPASSFTLGPSVDSAQKEKFLGLLNQALTEGNLPGSDFFEFLQGLRALAPSGLPEETKIATSLTLFSAQQVSPAQLLEAADHYLEILAKEVQDFKVFQDSEKEAKVTQILSEAEGELSEAQKKADQIQKLSQEILEHNQKAEELKKTAQASDTQIQISSLSFEAAKCALETEILGITSRLRSLSIPK